MLDVIKNNRNCLLVKVMIGLVQDRLSFLLVILNFSELLCKLYSQYIEEKERKWEIFKQFMIKNDNSGMMSYIIIRLISAIFWGSSSKYELESIMNKLFLARD